MRNSSIELLRCISIVLIMMVHIGFMAFGTPTPEYIRAEPCNSFFYILSQYISNICVDIFVLISGWFGIHAKWQSIGGLLFQCAYFSVLWSIWGLIFGRDQISVDGIYTIVSNFSLPHFVICYSIMYLFTPLINAYINTVPKRQYRNVVIIFFVVQTILGWLLAYPETFNRGYSAISFIGLYMLGRYVRLYTSLPEKSIRFHCMAYLILLLGGPLLIWILAISGKIDNVVQIIISKGGTFSSPLTIAKSVFLLLLFSKLTFNSKLFNWLGASAFAAVLLHSNYRVFPHKWISFFIQNYHTYSLMIYLVMTAIIFLLIFILAVILDQPRKWIWNRIIKMIEYKI